MKGLVCTALSSSFEDAISSLSITSLPAPELVDGSVRVQVRSVALNFFDLLMLVGKYQVKPPLPFVVATEGSGVITEIGEGVTEWKVGDKVIFSTLGSACEEVVVPTSSLIPLPSALSFEQGSGYQVAYMTAYHGLVQRGNLKEGETVLITGAGGGMGMSAIQIAKLCGAKVIAAASDDAKLEAAKKIGADEVINYKTHNLRDEVNKVTNGQFVDVIYEIVGGDVFKQCLRCVTPMGGARLLVIGFASGTIPKIPANLPLIKGFSVVGVRSGAQLSMDPEANKQYQDTVWKWADTGKLVPYVHSSVPLERYKEAFVSIMERKVVGKVVINFPEGGAKL
mmetsp:Transcript_23551/g.36725  ORF Transcript_23551/g.36725 Transcript_23551/m.36725 type:complete len:338 (-) Transcript_23551:28-1041(-)